RAATGGMAARKNRTQSGRRGQLIKLLGVTTMGIQSKMVPETILNVQEVTVAFGGFKALNELNFSMERGELRVVIGPNGAGKTTLLDVITGKVRPTSGKVLFQPHERPVYDITRLPEQEIARLGVGRKFQTPNVFKSLSVLD